MEASDTSFHGMGREDIDVRCLGSGRPFVLEIKGPRVRETDLEKLTEEINSESSGKVEVNSLRWSQKRERRIAVSFCNRRLNVSWYRNINLSHAHVGAF